MSKRRATNNGETQGENPKRDNNNRGVVKAEPTKLIRQGRVTRNPFLNFLREVRKKCTGMSVLEISMKGAEMWRKMSRIEKEPFLQMARQAPKRKRRRRRRRRRHRRHSYETDDEQTSDESFTESRRRHSGKSRSRSRHNKSRSRSRITNSRSRSRKKH